MTEPSPVPAERLVHNVENASISQPVSGATEQNAAKKKSRNRKKKKKKTKANGDDSQPAALDETRGAAISEKSKGESSGATVVASPNNGTSETGKTNENMAAQTGEASAKKRNRRRRRKAKAAQAEEGMGMANNGEMEAENPQKQATGTTTSPLKNGDNKKSSPSPEKSSPSPKKSLRSPEKSQSDQRREDSSGTESPKRNGRTPRKNRRAKQEKSSPPTSPLAVDGENVNGLPQSSPRHSTQDASADQTDAKKSRRQRQRQRQRERVKNGTDNEGSSDDVVKLKESASHEQEQQKPRDLEAAQPDEGSDSPAQMNCSTGSKGGEMKNDVEVIDESEKKINEASSSQRSAPSGSKSPAGSPRKLEPTPPSKHVNDEQNSVADGTSGFLEPTSEGSTETNVGNQKAEVPGVKAGENELNGLSIPLDGISSLANDKNAMNADDNMNAFNAFTAEGPKPGGDMQVRTLDAIGSNSDGKNLNGLTKSLDKNPSPTSDVGTVQTELNDKTGPTARDLSSPVPSLNSANAKVATNGKSRPVQQPFHVFGDPWLVEVLVGTGPLADILTGKVAVLGAAMSV